MMQNSPVSILVIILISLLFVMNINGQTIPEKGEIVVGINGIEPEEGGTLIVLLFDNEDSWLEPDKYKLIQQITELRDTMLISFSDLPFDSLYAIEVIHDKNDNHKLDMRTLPYPKPKEGFGVSNNTFRMGPPSYEKACIDLFEPSVEIEINMRY